MITVGLITQATAPPDLSHLHTVATVVVRVNARPGPEPTPWLGFGANHNRLLQDVHDSDWYVALNPDVQVTADQLYALIEKADRGGYSLASPLRIEPWGLQGNPDEPLPTWGYFLKATLWPMRIRSGDVAALSHKAIVDTAWAGGCCLAIRGDVGRELGFDERFFMYFEDVDLSLRASRLGARIGVCTAVTVAHATGWRSDDPLIGRRGVEYARSAMAFAEAHERSQRLMRAAMLTWAGVRIAAPGRSAAANAASRAIARGLVSPRSPGLAELATAHNRLHAAR